MRASAGVETPPPIRWDGRRLHILDQTLLPGRAVALELTGAEDTAAAIARLAVRGAPLIGIAAAYGLAMEVAREPSLGTLDRGAELLAHARPTARNLAWAVARVRAAALSAGPLGLAAAAREEAEAIHREEEAASAALARHGADLLEAELAARGSAPPKTGLAGSGSGATGAAPPRLLTHCNTGALAAAGRGTALGVLAELADRRPVVVLACEARPLLQGARLTVWELRRWGIPHELVVDSAAAGLMRAGHVDAVITGVDRVAANGDVANKVGTYGLALAARAAGIPFVAAGPSSSLDLDLPSGDDIVIEERDPDEVRTVGGALLTVPGTACRNPAFDVTPAELISALVTEKGAARPVSRETVAAVA
jgi:methylthioribose-1-phosphate isomerase